MCNTQNIIRHGNIKEWLDLIHRQMLNHSKTLRVYYLSVNTHDSLIQAIRYILHPNFFFFFIVQKSISPIKDIITAPGMGKTGLFIDGGRFRLKSIFSIKHKWHPQVTTILGIVIVSYCTFLGALSRHQI